MLDQVAPPPLRERPALDVASAAGMAALFKILASDNRLRLLHALHRGGDVRVTDLAADVGEPASRVQTAATPRRPTFVGTRRDGNNIYDRIIDACVPRLLELGWCLYDTAQQPPR